MTHIHDSLDITVGLVAMSIFTFFSRIQDTLSNCFVAVIFNMQGITARSEAVVLLTLSWLKAWSWTKNITILAKYFLRFQSWFLIGEKFLLRMFHKRTNEKSEFRKRTFTNGMIVIPVIQIFQHLLYGFKWIWPCPKPTQIWPGQTQTWPNSDGQTWPDSDLFWP